MVLSLTDDEQVCCPVSCPVVYRSHHCPWGDGMLSSSLYQSVLASPRAPSLQASPAPMALHPRRRAWRQVARPKKAFMIPLHFSCTGEEARTQDPLSEQDLDALSCAKAKAAYGFARVKLSKTSTGRELSRRTEQVRSLIRAISTSHASHRREETRAIRLDKSCMSKCFALSSFQLHISFVSFHCDVFSCWATRKIACLR